MTIVGKVAGFAVTIGGEPHSGWLPPGAAMPLPTPIRHVVLDLEIEFDESGYLLCYVSRDGTVSGDTWHQSLEEAKEAATAFFGIERSRWT
jgi:hypothetical protein